DVVADIVVVAHATSLLYDAAEQKEAVVAVIPTAAGLEFERAAAVELHVVVERAQPEAVLEKLWTEDVSGATSMRQQVIDRHFGRDVLVGIVGEVLPYRIAKRQLARLHELQCRDGGEHFVHGADAKAGVERVWDFVFAVGEAVGLGKYRFAV